MLKYSPLLKIEGNMRKRFTNLIGGTGIRFEVDGDNVTVFATGEASAMAETLGGDTLNANVVNSSLETVATISAGVWEGNPVNVSFGGTGAATAADARNNLGLAIGTHVQAYSADITALASLTATTDNMIQSVAGAWASRTPAQVRTALGLVIGTNVQAYDSDLAAIAALTATTDNIIQSVAGAWSSRTPAQLKATLALSKTDVGLSNVDNTSDATKNSAVASLTNKDVQKRVVVTTQSATPTINTNNGDIFQITGLAQAITSMTTNLSGSPYHGQEIIIEITDNGTARAITWGASFESSTITLPNTTVISLMLTVKLRYNFTTLKWRCVGAV